VLTVAYQERNSRYDIRKIDTLAERTREGYRLSGKKAHVLDGQAADAIVVSARGEDGVTLFVIDPKAPGVTLTPETRIDSRGAAELKLDGVNVAEDAILGQLGHGMDVLSQVIDRATVGLSAEMLGSASQAFDDTLSYLKSRKQFDVTIGSFQALQHRAARLFIELSLARAAVVAAARTVDEAPEKLPRMAALAKAQTSDLVIHVANEAVQMHGGIGVTDELHLGFYLKRARTAEITFGDGAWHRRRWAELGGY
jgi:alkylation response protein AidB-like acyl-CoA dehydrogenase